MNVNRVAGPDFWEQNFPTKRTLEDNSVLSDGVGDNHTSLGASGNFSLLIMNRHPSGVFKLTITPILDNFLFKIFFFIIATSVVFLISIATAFIFMKLMYYLSDLVEVK